MQAGSAANFAAWEDALTEAWQAFVEARHLKDVQEERYRISGKTYHLDREVLGLARFYDFGDDSKAAGTLAPKLVACELWSNLAGQGVHDSGLVQMCRTCAGPPDAKLSSPKHGSKQNLEGVE